MLCLSRCEITGTCVHCFNLAMNIGEQFTFGSFVICDDATLTLLFNHTCIQYRCLCLPLHVCGVQHGRNYVRCRIAPHIHSEATAKSHR